MNAKINKFHAYLLSEKRVSHHTYTAYAKDLEQYEFFLQKISKTIDTADEQDIKDFLRHLKQIPVKSRTLCRKISALKLFYTYIHDTFEVKNIAQSIYFPKLEKTLPQCLTEAQVAALLATAQEDTTPVGMRNNMMIELLYVAGLRISELVHLLIENVQTDAGLIKVMGKGDKERVIPIPQSTMSKLFAYIKQDRVVLLRTSPGHELRSEYLFFSLYGKKIKPFSRQGFWSLLKKVCLQANLPTSISPHQLRHSLATHLLKKGADLRLLQLLLGHENVATVQIYTHLENSYLRDVYNKKHPRK